MVAVEEDDSKATASRQRKLVLDHLGYREFGTAAEHELVSELRSMVRSQVRPKFMLLRIVEFLKVRKTEIPSAYTLLLSGSLEPQFSEEEALFPRNMPSRDHI